MTATKDLLTLAVELSMLSAEVAENLSREATRSGETAESLLVRGGLLTSTQLDVLRTLHRPRDIIPGYELLSLIGHGGMGVVYRARQRALDRIVAVKTILVSEMSDAKFATRFEQEARAVAKLQHPNIIQAIDFGQHEGRLFFVMEFVEGTDLESSLRAYRERGLVGAAAEELAWCLARQTAAGLAHAAEAGIVHRDIKPANLLLVDPPAGFPLPPGMPLVKIADFGLAFLTNEADVKTRVTAANAAVGSPHYMAPEQLSGQPVDARADIYALGATLFHMLAGQPPFAKLNLAQVLAQKLTSETPRVKSVSSDVSTETDELIADMMTRRPEDRIRNYATLLKLIDGRGWGSGATTLADRPKSLLSRAANRDSSELATTIAQSFEGDPASQRVISDLPATEHSGILQPTQMFVAATTPAELPADTTRARQALVRRSSRRALFGTTGGLVVVATLGWLGWRILGRNLFGGGEPESLIATGRSLPLFDGRSLKNWGTRSGTWVLAEDDDGATVLAGTNGVTSRRFDGLLTRTQQSPNPYEIVLAAWLHQATAVEVGFGLKRGEDDGARLGLRLEGDSAWLVTRSQDRATPQAVSRPVRLSLGNRDTPRLIRIARGIYSWSAFIDDGVIAVHPHLDDLDAAEIRLIAESGPAWFADIRWNELRVP